MSEKLKTLTRQLLDAVAENELTMVTAIERYPCIQRIGDMINEDLVTLERYLQGKRASVVTVAVGDVAWRSAGKRHRVLYKGKPLLESSLADRLEGFQLVPELVHDIGRKLTVLVEDLNQKLGFTA